MNKTLLHKKPYRDYPKAYKAGFYDEEISDTGKKGGRVEKERQQAHQIDLELRSYTYR